MADLAFNIGLGREIELFQRVMDDDPLGCGIVVVVLASADGTWAIEDDSILKDYETLWDLLNANPEVTNAGYDRFVFSYLDLSPWTVDHTRDRVVAALPMMTWTNVANDGDIWAKAVVCYAPDVGGGSDDLDMIPLTAHELRYNGSYLVPNGTNINVDLTSGFVQVT